VKIDIWSDVVCPFCWLGKRHLEKALEGFTHREQVELVWHSFQLDPTAPAVSAETTPEHLARKYGMTLEQARASQQRLEQQAATVGLEYHLETTLTGNTFDAHRLLHLAAAEGEVDTVMERFMRGYFTENLAIGDHDVLVRLAVEAGLDEERVRQVLAGDEFARAVRDDAEQARAYGARGVPFFVLGGVLGVSGAQPVELFEQALQQAWDTTHTLPMAGDGSVDEEAAACSTAGGC
jgi:predicted DsbA family dithiol-disulfide isomerase